MNAALREVAWTFLAVTLGTLAITFAGRHSPVAEHVAVLVGALFLWSALHMAQRQPAGIERYGLRLGGLLEPPERPPVGALGTVRDLLAALLRAAPAGLRELGSALAVASVVFPPFALGFFVWHAPAHGFELRWPPDLGAYLLSQLLVVALPEEALFRGYVQGRLGDAFPQQRRLLGVALSPAAWLLQAALFALIHYAVDLDPTRLAVFFPALLFGWVRALRGGIGAAAALHALCNLLSDVLARGWL
jgi:uncharacterized protein